MHVAAPFTAKRLTAIPFATRFACCSWGKGLLIEALQACSQKLRSMRMIRWAFAVSAATILHFNESKSPNADVSYHEMIRITRYLMQSRA